MFLALHLRDLTALAPPGPAQIFACTFPVPRVPLLFVAPIVVPCGAGENCFFVFFFFFFLAFRAAPAAYGGSQAWGGIRVAAAGLHHSHSNPGSGPRLQPTPQLMATPDLSPTGRGQGSWILVGFVTAEPRWELQNRCSLLETPHLLTPLFLSPLVSLPSIPSSLFPLTGAPHIDSSPYSPAYLSPPPESSWRRSVSRAGGLCCPLSVLARGGAGVGPGGVRL